MTSLYGRVHFSHDMKAVEDLLKISTEHLKKIYDDIAATSAPDSDLLLNWFCNVKKMKLERS